MGHDPVRIELGRTTSYRIETLDAGAELERLEAQVRLLSQMELPALRHAGVRPTDTFLDVGCGPGFFAAVAARELVPDGSVIGVDVDGALIDIANERAAADGSTHRFVLGTGVAIPLEDDSVDFAYARFLFQHLDAPEVVLAEMFRVVRPGGTVMVMDTDDGGLLMHPEPAGWKELLAASAAAQRARGGDRHVGRRLKSMLAAAGLESVRASARILTTDHVPPRAFVHLTVGFKAGVLGPPWISEEDLAAVTSALEAAVDQPDFFAHALGYGAWGRVPA